MPVMETEYENLRQNIAPQFANLSDAQLEASTICAARAARPLAIAYADVGNEHGRAARDRDNCADVSSGAPAVAY
jgi:hypothetical protein